MKKLLKVAWVLMTIGIFWMDWLVITKIEGQTLTEKATLVFSILDGKIEHSYYATIRILFLATLVFSFVDLCLLITWGFAQSNEHETSRASGKTTVPDPVVTPAAKTPADLLGELKTALVKTLRKRDREHKSDSAFWSSFSLVAESEEFGVVVLRSDSNNYGHQMSIKNYSGGSQAWQDLIIATRKGYCFLGTINIYDRNQKHYNGPYSISKDGDKLKVTCDTRTFDIEDSSLNGKYDFPFELPPRSELVRTTYNLDGAIVVIDDDPYQGQQVQSSVKLLGDKLKADSTVWDLPGCVRSVDDAITYLPSVGKSAKLVLVDGNFSGDGRGFNASRLIPALRKRYPNAILFANSGKGEHHANYDRDLLRAGCDYALPEEESGYKSDLPKVLARVAKFRPEILVTESLDLNKVLKI